MDMRTQIEMKMLSLFQGLEYIMLGISVLLPSPSPPLVSAPYRLAGSDSQCISDYPDSHSSD